MQTDKAAPCGQPCFCVKCKKQQKILWKPFPHFFRSPCFVCGFSRIWKFPAKNPGFIPFQPVEKVVENVYNFFQRKIFGGFLSTWRPRGTRRTSILCQPIWISLVILTRTRGRSLDSRQNIRYHAEGTCAASVRLRSRYFRI